MLQQTVAGAWTDFVLDLAGNVLAETTASGWQVGYVYNGGGLLAEYTNSTTHFVHRDHLGSARLVTDVTGYYVTDCNDFYPFGERSATGPCWSNSQNPSNLSHKFTGDERDSETNLDHTWFRKYSSQFGRWTTPDPAGLMAVSLDSPQSLNRYSHVNNMPLSYFDPSGLTTCDANGNNCYDSVTVTAGGGGGVDFCFLSGLCGGGAGGGFGIAPLQDEPPPLIYIGDRGGGGVLVPCLAGAGPLQPGQSYCGAKLDPCANATLSATGVNTRENIAQAQSTISVGRMMGITGGSYNAARGTVGALFNYAMLVGTGGPQDVKNQRGPGTPQQRCRKHKLRYYLFFRHSLLSVRGRCRSNSHCQAKFQRHARDGI